MKRLLCILAACMLFLSLCSAEDMDGKITRMGIAAANEMIEKTQSSTAVPRALWETWTEIDAHHPGRVLVIVLSEDQAESACMALGIEAFSDAAPVLAETINNEFWDLYAEKAKLVISEMNETGLEEPVIIVLAYGEHLVAASCANGSLKASFIISDYEVSENLDQATIKTYTDQLGLTEPEVRIYEGETLEKLLASE